MSVYPGGQKEIRTVYFKNRGIFRVINLIDKLTSFITAPLCHSQSSVGVNLGHFN